MNGADLYAVGRNGYIMAEFLPRGQEHTGGNPLVPIQGMLGFLIILVIAFGIFYYMKGR